MTRVQEREAEVRAAAFEAFDALYPNVRGNEFIPHWPTPPQARFLGLHLLPEYRLDEDDVFEALYGGAAGGGKSDALLMAAAQYTSYPEFACAMFRRTYKDLAKAGALMDRAIEWWGKKAHWNGSDKVFTFPSGARVEMAYMSKPLDHLDHQGAEYHATFWDELTQHPTDAQYEYVGVSRVRRKAGCKIPLRSMSASNPGGPGHTWVKTRFVGGRDITTGAEIAPRHPYVRALIQDNPHLDQRAYIRGLERLHPTLREQLLRGDWDARDPGDYFRVEWFGPLLDPELDAWAQRDKVSVRWWDLAASEKESACRTASVKMARHRSGVRAIEHAIAFRLTPGSRDDRIVQVAKADGYGTTVGIEIEPGSGGQAQFDALEKRLKHLGFRVAGKRPRAEVSKAEGKYLTSQPTSEKGKQGRADPVASCLERGYQRRGECPDTGGEWWGLDEFRTPPEQRDGLRLFAGPWTQPYLDEVEGFPEAELCDLVDATSGAWAYLEAHPFGARIPGAQEDRRAPAEPQNIHPADRPDIAETGKNRHGRWTQ